MKKNTQDFIELMGLLSLIYGALMVAYWALIIILIWSNAIEAMYYLTRVFSSQQLMIWAFLVPGGLGILFSAICARLKIKPIQAYFALVLCALGVAVPILVLISYGAGEEEAFAVSRMAAQWIPMGCLRA